VLQVHSLAPPAQPKRLCVSLTPSMRLEGCSRGTPRDGRMYRLRLRVESDMQLFGEGVGRSGRMGARHGRPPHQLVMAFCTCETGTERGSELLQERGRELQLRITPARAQHHQEARARWGWPARSGRSRRCTATGRCVSIERLLDVSVSILPEWHGEWTCGGDAITCKEGGAVGGMRRELLLVRAEQCCAMGRTREIDQKDDPKIAWSKP
jgi:hypothetical protein